MHPDRKIGIALGILLVGVVGALFFRNEPLPEDESLSMRREHELNEQLRERDIALYSAETPEEEDTDSAQVQLADLLKRRNTKGTTPGPIHRDDELPTVAKPDRQAVEEPLDFTPPKELLVGTGNGSQPADSPTESFSAVLEGATTQVRELPAANLSFDEYTVQFGDTLSGIAGKYLGSQNRYREIYEANKDRLKSPDDLKVGKAIRIPRVLR